jgi:uncharacterized paraquat-inducible protein A
MAIEESAIVPDDQVPKPAAFCRTCGQAVKPEAEMCRCGEPPRNGSNFCAACGDPTYADERVCPRCGATLVSEGRSSRTVVGSRGTSPVAMAIISFIIPGLGQLLMGQTTKAIVMFFITILLVSRGEAAALFWLLSPLDAYRLAKRLRAGKAIGRWDFF